MMWKPPSSRLKAQIDPVDLSWMTEADYAEIREQNKDVPAKESKDWAETLQEIIRGK